MTKETNRLEAFSDGVFAIAITLLILEIRLPHTGAEGHLGNALLALWPSYVAFVFSFFVILVTWITHHDLMRVIRTSTRHLQLANGCCLLYVTFIPFPTAVLAAHLTGPDVSTAVAFYCGTFVFGSVAFNVLVATMKRCELVSPECVHILRRAKIGYRITLALYVCATLIALVAPWVALALNLAVRVFLLSIRYKPPAHVAVQEAHSSSRT